MWSFTAHDLADWFLSDDHYCSRNIATYQQYHSIGVPTSFADYFATCASSSRSSSGVCPPALAIDATAIDFGPTNIPTDGKFRKSSISRGVHRTFFEAAVSTEARKITTPVMNDAKKVYAASSGMGPKETFETEDQYDGNEYGGTMDAGSMGFITEGTNSSNKLSVGGFSGEMGSMLGETFDRADRFLDLGSVAIKRLNGESAEEEAAAEAARPKPKPPMLNGIKNELDLKAVKKNIETAILTKGSSRFHSANSVDGYTYDMLGLDPKQIAQDQVPQGRAHPPCSPDFCRMVYPSVGMLDSIVKPDCIKSPEYAFDASPLGSGKVSPQCTCDNVCPIPSCPRDQCTEAKDHWTGATLCQHTKMSRFSKPLCSCEGMCKPHDACPSAYRSGTPICELKYAEPAAVFKGVQRTQCVPTEAYKAMNLSCDCKGVCELPMCQPEDCMWKKNFIQSLTSKFKDFEPKGAAEIQQAKKNANEKGEDYDPEKFVEENAARSKFSCEQNRKAMREHKTCTCTATTMGPGEAFPRTACLVDETAPWKNGVTTTGDMLWPLAGNKPSWLDQSFKEFEKEAASYELFGKSLPEWRKYATQVYGNLVKHGFNTFNASLEAAVIGFTILTITAGKAINMTPVMRDPLLREHIPSFIRDVSLQGSGALRGREVHFESGVVQTPTAVKLATSTSAWLKHKFAEKFPKASGAIFDIGKAGKDIGKNIAWSLSAMAQPIMNPTLFDRIGNSDPGENVLLMAHQKKQFYRPEDRSTYNLRKYLPRVLVGDTSTKVKENAIMNLQTVEEPRGTEYPYGISEHSTDKAVYPWNLTNEPQLLLYSKSDSIEKTNITDSNQFTCWQAGETTPVRRTAHPWIRFADPQGKIHVKVKDLETMEVKWDAIYDLGGWKTLYPNAPAIAGSRPDFYTFCVPQDDGPHSFAMDIYRVGSVIGKMEKFGQWLGGAVINAYTPLHDPNAYGLPRLLPDDPKVSMLNAGLERPPFYEL